MQEPSIRNLGREVRLTSNFFRFTTLPIDTVYGYYIEYLPEVDVNNKILKKTLLRNSRQSITEAIGTHFYYDLLISTTKRLEPFSVISKGPDEVEYTLAIRYVSAIEPGSIPFIWYLNVLIKLQQRNLGLKQITNKPTFFNSDQVVELPSIGLSI